MYYQKLWKNYFSNGHTVVYLVSSLLKSLISSSYICWSILGSQFLDLKNCYVLTYLGFIISKVANCKFFKWTHCDLSTLCHHCLKSHFCKIHVSSLCPKLVYGFMVSKVEKTKYNQYGFNMISKDVKSKFFKWKHCDLPCVIIA